MLPGRRASAIQIPLHSSAEQLALEYIDAFGESLILQAKLLAYKRDDVLVLSSHIREALEVMDHEKERKWWREGSIIVFGTLFGAGAQGFISELGINPARSEFIAAWAILAFISLVFVFIGLVSGRG